MNLKFRQRNSRHECKGKLPTTVKWKNYQYKIQDYKVSLAVMAGKENVTLVTKVSYSGFE